MSHGITESDRMVLVKRPAWHGLGEVLPEAPSVAEAMRRVLPWEVEVVPAYYRTPVWGPAAGGSYAPHLAAPGQVVLRVEPDHSAATPLAVVGPGYIPLLNADFGALAEAAEVAGGGTVKVETAGSLRGGRHVFALLRTGEYEVRRGDPTATYLALLNGHDGSLALRSFLTTVRVVCANTEAQALGRARGRGLTVVHDAGLPARVEVFRKALAAHGHDVALRQEEDRALMAHRVPDGAAVGAYFARVYERWTGRPFPDVVDKGATAEERARLERAHDAAERYVGPMLAELDNARQDGVRGTAYGLLQAVTRVADWERPAIAGRRLGDVAADKLLGSGARLKAAGRAVARELAGVRL